MHCFKGFLWSLEDQGKGKDQGEGNELSQSDLPFGQAVWGGGMWGLLSHSAIKPSKGAWGPRTHQFGWYCFCFCQPHQLYVPSWGPEDLGDHVLLLLGSCTLSLPPTKKGKVLEGLPLFLPSWLEGNAQLLKENIRQDSGLRNNLEGLSLGQVSGSPQLYQFANCESKHKKQICWQL